MDMMRVIAQKTEEDCTVAALAMFLGLSYNTILKVARQFSHNPEKEGMFLTEMIRVARKLGYKLRYGRYSPKKLNGILAVTNRAAGWRLKGPKGKPAPHVVVVWNGVIVDPV